MKQIQTPKPKEPSTKEQIVSLKEQLKEQQIKFDEFSVIVLRTLAEQREEIVKLREQLLADKKNRQIRQQRALKYIKK
jgi:hypothetical protein